MALVAIAVYANALRNGFTLDDRVIVLENPNVHHLSNFGTAWISAYWPNLPFRDGLYRPLTIISYMVQWALWHGHAMGFHAVNVGLHAVVSALVVVLLLKFDAPPLAAAIGGLLFAIHPVHVEAVAGVVGYAEVMMTLLVLVACLIHLSRAGPVVLRWVGITACFLAALLVKETAVALPVLLVVTDYLNPRREQALWRVVWSDAPLYLLMAAVFGGYMGLRFAVLGVFTGTAPAAALAGASTAARLATAVRTWLDYIRLSIWPQDLVAEYGPNVRVMATWRDWTVYAGAAAGGAVLASAVFLRRRVPWWTAAVAWFVAAVFVVSNLVIPVGIVLAERTLYLPSVGLAFAAVPIVAVARRRPRIAVTVGLVLAGLAVARTWTRTPAWQSTGVLLTRLARDHPESFEAQTFLGDSAMHAGHPQQAVAHYSMAWRMVPDQAIGGSYARALLKVHDWPEAERIARASCGVMNPGACLSLVDALIGGGRFDSAQTELDSLVAHAPPSPLIAERWLTVARAMHDSAGIAQAEAYSASAHAPR